MTNKDTVNHERPDQIQNRVGGEAALRMAIHFMKLEPADAVLKLMENGYGLNFRDPQAVEASIRKTAEQYAGLFTIDGKREITEDEIDKMTPQQYLERQDEVHTFLKKKHEAKRGQS
jgi:hypothetical protein